MTILVYDPIFLEHETGAHPEAPERLTAVVEHLQSMGVWRRLAVVPPRRATEEEVLLVHAPGYVDLVRRVSASGGGFVALETPVSKRSYEVALHAVGAGLVACDRVLEGAGTAFCAVRPPGHHAGPAGGEGFCIFNNVAVAARYLQRRHGLTRILIVDWDVHHGNGTQEAFYSDPTVHYFSLHQAPFYPGTGWTDECGRGPGRGFTTNVPLRPYTVGAQYVAIFTETLTGIVEAFRPEFVLVSAGFDAHEADPLANLRLRVEDFGALTREVVRQARQAGARGVVSVLEGGYHPVYLPLCVAAHLEALLEAG